MSRLARCFAALKAQGRTALIPYVTAGDPNPEVSVPLMHAMAAAGADIIELGVPFSDPMADGPVIQQACERALLYNTGLRDVINMVKAFRETDQDTPVVLMGYLNPVEVMGYEAFAKVASQAGVDGLLTVDMPPEEATEMLVHLQRYEIDPIFLLAPTSNSVRMEKIAQSASGFVYYVSLKGVTGAASLDVSSVETKVGEIRQHTDMPIGVGFGISNAESAAAVSKIADAVVVGSVLVKQIAANKDTPEKIVPALSITLSEMRKAMDA